MPIRLRCLLVSCLGLPLSIFVIAHDLLFKLISFPSLFPYTISSRLSCFESHRSVYITARHQPATHTSRTYINKIKLEAFFLLYQDRDTITIHFCLPHNQTLAGLWRTAALDTIRAGRNCKSFSNYIYSIRLDMCYQLVELYSACRCLYYQHAIDRCAAYGRPGHDIQQRTIYVGYACSAHSSQGAQYASPHTYSDSGYYSSRSSHKSYR